ncbi:uncharacterized protein LOC106880400 [Octopus bimaculoides]|uniref:Apple domain-containing protein n=1 Tax=Octopus bimaculoides TaxID=37653 RepID=A0A0L8FY73_OCTBM|nr:uncharacterized protein LOC106880400 [Octopus bimaculoides]|eukprot:XP_014785803.1 PREDICTED: uncharacterized protein LOC106880400 [Octopus bimaculoides]
METSIQCHLTLLLLPALTLVVFVTQMTGESAYRNGLFRKISSSKCVSDQRISTAETVSVTACSIWCMSQDECQYFSYCKGTCHMYRLWYNKEIEDYDCNCSSYISFPANGTSWQRIFEMTKDSFTRSLIYLYCDRFPMAEKEFRLKIGSNHYLTFNGTGTNSTSWLQKDKIIFNTHPAWIPRKFTFNKNFSYPFFSIEYDNNWSLEAKRRSGNVEKYDIPCKNPSGKVQWSYSRLVFSVLLK